MNTSEVDRQEWSFEAWRKCSACGGSGKPEQPTDGIGQTSYPMFAAFPMCPVCNLPDDPLKRPGQERKGPFTRAQLDDFLRLEPGEGFAASDEQTPRVRP